MNPETPFSPGYAPPAELCLSEAIVIETYWVARNVDLAMRKIDPFFDKNI